MRGIYYHWKGWWGCVKERATSFLRELTNIVLRAAEQAKGQISSPLFDLLTDTFFEVGTFKWSITSLVDYKYATARNKRDLMKYDGFHTVLVRGVIAMKSGYGTLYVKDETVVLQKNVNLCGEDYIRFPSGWKTFCQELYHRLWQQIIFECATKNEETRWSDLMTVASSGLSIVTVMLSCLRTSFSYFLTRPQQHSTRRRNYRTPRLSSFLMCLLEEGDGWYIMDIPWGNIRQYVLLRKKSKMMRLSKIKK